MNSKFQRVIAEKSAISHPERPPMRPEMREDDPRSRAAARAAEIRQQHNGNMDEGTDEFYVPPNIVPEGWTYEWKRP